MTSILKVDTIQDADGNNIINESGNTITIGASGDTISIPSGATIANSGTATGFGGDNTPSWSATIDSNQTLSDSTDTLLNFDNETYDTDGAYDTSNKRFTVPSGEAGKYFITTFFRASGLTNVTSQFRLQIKFDLIKQDDLFLLIDYFFWLLNFLMLHQKRYHLLFVLEDFFRLLLQQLIVFCFHLLIYILA